MKFLRVLWNIWAYVLFPPLMVLGTISWWVEPLFLGPIWGRLFAAYLTFVVFIIFRDYYRRWRDRKNEPVVPG